VSTNSAAGPRSDELCREIDRHLRLYHLQDQPEISDAEYDLLFRELEGLEGKHPGLRRPDSPTLRVGFPPADGFETAAHLSPMLSLDNAMNEEEMRAFNERVLKGLDRDDEAVAVLRRIRMLEPSDIEAAFQLAIVLGERSEVPEASGASEASEAVEILSELLRRAPCDERFQLEQSRRLRQLARYAELVERLAQAAESCPEMASNLNNYAWALATLPDAELRDGAKAVRIMRDVLSRAGEPDAAYQDTLAAALAEAGVFEEAIRTGAAALQRVEADGGSGPVVDELRRHLDAYRSGIAIRDPESS